MSNTELVHKSIIFTKVKTLTYIVFLVSILIVPVGTVNAAELSFEKSEINIELNGTTEIGVVLDPKNKQIIGLDLVITYDPKYIEIVDIIKGPLFPSLLAKVIDNAKGTAKVGLAISIPSSKENINTITSTGTPAIVKIKSKKETTNTVVKFEYVNGGTKDSNVAIAGGVDALTKVSPLKVTITKSTASGNSNSTTDTNNSNATEFNNNSASAILGLAQAQNSSNNSTNKTKKAGIGNKVRDMMRESKQFVEKKGEQFFGKVLGDSDQKVSGINFLAIVAFGIFCILMGFVVGALYKNKNSK